MHLMWTMFGLYTKGDQASLSMVIVVDGVTVASAHVCWRCPPAHSYVIGCLAVSYRAEVVAL